MSTVFANSRSIVHKGDGLTNVAAAPDVCKTPTPTGPVPLPYPNIANDSDLADGTKTVTIEGSPVAVDGSSLAISTGDEAGSAGGVISSKTKGKMTWLSSSPNVFFEGKGVVRFLDTCMHNGNAPNTGGQPQMGMPTSCESAEAAVCKDGPTWVELRYLHCDGTPVKNAKYHIECQYPGFSKDGQLDGDGFARVDLPTGSRGVLYWLYDDPEVYEPRKPAIATTAPMVESSSNEVLEWIWGTLQGDFNENQSLSQIAVNTALGLIPYVDQVLDARDLLANVLAILKFYCEDEATQALHLPSLGLSYETWLWINVLISAIGCIPELGSVLKGLVKGIVKALKDAAVKVASELSASVLKKLWQGVLEILNFLAEKQGNAHTWLKKLPEKLDVWMEMGAAKLEDALRWVEYLIGEVMKYKKDVEKKLVQLVKDAFSKARKRLVALKPDAVAWIKKQLDSIIEAKEPPKHAAVVEAPAPKEGGTNVLMQKAEEPPESLPQQGAPATPPPRPPDDADPRRRADAERKAAKKRERDLNKRAKSGDKDATLEQNTLRAQQQREAGNTGSAEGYEAENRVIRERGDSVVEAGREVEYPDPQSPGRTISSDIDMETKKNVTQIKSGTEMPSRTQADCTRLRAAETGKQPEVIYDPAKMPQEQVDAFKTTNPDFILTPKNLH